MRAMHAHPVTMALAAALAAGLAGGCGDEIAISGQTVGEARMIRPTVTVRVQDRDVTLFEDMRLLPGSTMTVDDHGRAAIVVCTAGRGTELIERVEQVGDGALAHAFDAVESVGSVSERRQRSEKPDRGAAVGAVKVRFEGEDAAAGAVDDERATGVAPFHDDAEVTETVNHDACVFAVECPGKRRMNAREYLCGREIQEGAVFGD